VFRTYIETTETNRTDRNKPKRFSTEHLQLQPGLHSCWQTRPGASQSSCRQTRTGAAKILADRHVQVQHKAPVGRHIQVQRKALVDRHLYVEHKALVDRHARCSTKVLENTKKTRPGAAQALADRQYRCSTCCCRPYTSWHSIGCCWTNTCIWSTSMQLQATHLRGQYRLLHCRADTQTRPGKAQTAVEETSSRAAQAAIEETHVQRQHMLL